MVKNLSLTARNVRSVVIEKVYKSVWNIASLKNYNQDGVRIN